MQDLDSGLLEFESALDADTKRAVARLGSADILIGIPSHRNGRTIAEVIDAIYKGVQSYMPGRRVVLMNADGGSSDNTVRHVRETEMPPNVEKLLCTYEGAIGKGTAIRAILEAAARLHVRACLVIEARAPGITPEWLHKLTAPILQQGDDITIPCYHRSAYAMALNDNMIYPFFHTFFGADLRDPIAGEFCVSGETARDLVLSDVWETNISRFGVNVWIAAHALTSGMRISQVDLGYRGEPGGEPGMPLDARFLHSVATLFRLLTTHRRVWQRESASRQVCVRGCPCADEPIPCEDCIPTLLAAFREGVQRYGDDEWVISLDPETRRAVCALSAQPERAFAFPAELWAKIVLSFAMLFNKGEGDPDKVAEALLPIFYGRTAAYMLETAGMAPMQRQEVVQGVVEAFEALRRPFVEQWNTYQPWVEDSSLLWSS